MIKTGFYRHLTVDVTCFTCHCLAVMDTVCGLVCVCQFPLIVTTPRAACPLSFHAETVKAEGGI